MESATQTALVIVIQAGRVVHAICSLVILSTTVLTTASVLAITNAPALLGTEDWHVTKQVLASRQRTAAVTECVKTRLLVCVTAVTTETPVTNSSAPRAAPGGVLVLHLSFALVAQGGRA